MSQDHPHSHDADTDMFSQDFWDTHYNSAESIWSGNPNPQLIEYVTGLTPGTALDVGCGEGADAVWLARQGWQVTGLDVSQVALDRAATHASKASVADRTTWEQADLRVWEPTRQFDLVSAHFVHLPSVDRGSLHARLSSAVRPGGSLLIVGHHPSDLRTAMGRPDAPDMFFTAEEVAADLDPAEWEIATTAAPGREARNPAGESVMIRDAIVHAIRRR